MTRTYKRELAELRSRLHLTNKDIAEGINKAGAVDPETGKRIRVSQAAVGKWVKGETAPSPEYRRVMTSVWGVDFAADEGKIPLLGEKDPGEVAGFRERAATGAEPLLTPPSGVGPGCFAYRVRDSSMRGGKLAGIPEGAFVAVDPELPRELNHRVVCAADPSGFVLIREYVVDGGIPTLQAWNKPATVRPIIRLDEVPCSVMGVCVACWFPL